MQVLHICTLILLQLGISRSSFVSGADGLLPLAGGFSLVGFIWLIIASWIQICNACEMLHLLPANVCYFHIQLTRSEIKREKLEVLGERLALGGRRV